MLDQSLEVKAGQLLVLRGLTVATAESCTGGLVAHLLTNVSGSSAYVLGGIVAYSNEIKQALLSVDPSTLEQFGAVSEPVALEMARGARQRFGADIAVSTTGIAGPTGGTPDKPVGLVFVGLSSAHGDRCERFVWDGDRIGNKQRSAEAALQLLIGFLENGQDLAHALSHDRDDDRPSGEAVSIDMALGADGRLTIRSLIWRGHEVTVTATGRQWVEESPGSVRRCVLVMSSDNTTFELCLDGADALWHIRKTWSPGYIV